MAKKNTIEKRTASKSAMKHAPSDCKAKPNLPPEHWVHQRSLIHETEVYEDVLGITWATWKAQYRCRIPGFTTKQGRWYRGADVDGFVAQKIQEDAEKDKSEIGNRLRRKRNS